MAGGHTAAGRPPCQHSTHLPSAHTSSEEPQGLHTPEILHEAKCTIMASAGAKAVGVHSSVCLLLCILMVYAAKAEGPAMTIRQPAITTL